MAGITLYDYQKDALERMKIGCILCGGVGSGKSRTSLAFYYTLYGGTVNTKNYVKMHDPPDLCIITTARKRDTGEWEEELAHFYMSTDSDLDIYNHKVFVDSWNNIGKYVGKFLGRAIALTLILCAWAIIIAFTLKVLWFIWFRILL